MSNAPIAQNERALLARIEQDVRAVEPEATVLLYGSRARGDARAGSDWDILVLVDGPVDARRDESVDRRMLDLCAETGAEISVLTLSRNDWNSPRWRVLPFHQNVDADAIVLTPNGHGVPFITEDVTEDITEEEMAEAREELVRTWLRQAQDTLADAEYLAEGRRWKSCVGRIYYAAFYAVSALLVNRGYNFSSHRGVETLFNQDFGATGAVPADLVALYNELHKNRLLADYSGTTRFEETQVRPWIASTRRLLAAVEQLIQPPAGR